MLTALLFDAGFLFLGAALGCIALARWFTRRMQDPEVARDHLKRSYRVAHPHWLQGSADEPERVCPCCGWSEAEGRAREPLRQEPSKLFGVKVISVRWLAREDGTQVSGGKDTIEGLAKELGPPVIEGGVYVAYQVRPLPIATDRAE